MSVNLATKYETKLDERYKLQSRTERYCGTNYNWEGTNAIKVWTLESAELNDYNNSASSNRFGTPSEVDDEVNTYTLAKKRSFSKVFDITNVQDTMFVRKANAYLKQMWDEKYVPEIDKYRLLTWANGAGQGKVDSTTITKNNIMELLLKGHAALDDAFVPNENRATFVRSDVAVSTKLATELNNNQTYTSKAIIRGQIGEINGSPVISVPYSIMPAGVAFMIKYKQASADPMKLKMLRANSDAPGYAGTLMEGLCRYDSFVLANKADGIYVYALSGMSPAVVGTYDTTNSKVVLKATDSTAIYYTVDGTNPKTSATKATYSTSFACSTGVTVLAYSATSGSVNSPVLTYVAGA